MFRINLKQMAMLVVLMALLAGFTANEQNQVHQSLKIVTFFPDDSRILCKHLPRNNKRLLPKTWTVLIEFPAVWNLDTNRLRHLEKQEGPDVEIPPEWAYRFWDDESVMLTTRPDAQGRLGVTDNIWTWNLENRTYSLASGKSKKLKSKKFRPLPPSIDFQSRPTFRKILKVYPDLKQVGINDFWYAKIDQDKQFKAVISHQTAADRNVDRFSQFAVYDNSGLVARTDMNHPLFEGSRWGPPVPSQDWNWYFFPINLSYVEDPFADSRFVFADKDLKPLFAGYGMPIYSRDLQRVAFRETKNELTIVDLKSMSTIKIDLAPYFKTSKADPFEYVDFSFVFSNDSKKIAWSHESDLMVWNTETGELIHRYQPPRKYLFWFFSIGLVAWSAIAAEIFWPAKKSANRFYSNLKLFGCGVGVILIGLCCYRAFVFRWLIDEQGVEIFIWFAFFQFLILLGIRWRTVFNTSAKFSLLDVLGLIAGIVMVQAYIYHWNSEFGGSIWLFTLLLLGVGLAFWGFRNKARAS